MKAAKILIRIEFPTHEKPQGYMSAYSTSPPREGEAWERSNYLDDGPANEASFQAIMDDVRWLGFAWNGEVRWASDYFQALYDYAEMIAPER
jgi:hypothetical protein